MCMSSGSSKAPAPTPPTRFEYMPSSQSSVQRQAANYEAQGYQNTAGSYGSELGTGGTQLSGMAAKAEK